MWATRTDPTRAPDSRLAVVGVALSVVETRFNLVKIAIVLKTLVAGSKSVTAVSKSSIGFEKACTMQCSPRRSFQLCEETGY